MALISRVAWCGRPRIRRRIFQLSSWTFARSPGPRSRAWAELTAFWFADSLGRSSRSLARARRRCRTSTFRPAQRLADLQSADVGDTVVDWRASAQPLGHPPGQITPPGAEFRHPQRSVIIALTRARTNGCPAGLLAADRAYDNRPHHQLPPQTRLHGQRAATHPPPPTRPPNLTSLNTSRGGRTETPPRSDTRNTPPTENPTTTRKIGESLASSETLPDCSVQARHHLVPSARCGRGGI